MPHNNLTASGAERLITPSRLSVARERVCLTQRSLASKIDVTPDAICKYESGECSPTPDKVVRISLALGFPINWFYAPEIEVIHSCDLSFRSHRSMTVRTQSRVASIATMAAGVVSRALRQKFRFPTLGLADLSSYSPENAARVLREEWKLGYGPIPSMVHLLESKGIEIYWINEPVDHMDAWSFRKDDRAFIALNTYKAAGEREQFDTAHELGHLVLHHAQDKAPMGRDAEKEAHRFAGAFLLPAEQFRVECPRLPILDSFIPLKNRWRVSVAAMLYRCKDLGIYSDWHYQTMMKELSARGWRKGEPYQLQRQESKTHKIIFEKLAEKDVTPVKFAQVLNLPMGEVSEMMPTIQYYDDIRDDTGAAAVPQLPTVKKSRGAKKESTVPNLAMVR